MLAYLYTEPSPSKGAYLAVKRDSFYLKYEVRLLNIAEGKESACIEALLGEAVDLCVADAKTAKICFVRGEFA